MEVHDCDGKLRRGCVALCSLCRHGRDLPDMDDLPEFDAEYSDPVNKLMKEAGYEVPIEDLVVRTAYIADCDCGFKDIRFGSAPREMQCPECKRWIVHVKQTWVGPRTYLKSKTPS